MRAVKLAGLAVAGAALATPTISLGSGWLKPTNGTFAGRTSPYTSFHHRQTATVTLRVRGHEPSAFTLTAGRPPMDAKHSHGNICGAINQFSTRGRGASGSTAADGTFDYTFDRVFDHNGAEVAIDSITIKGRFTDQNHVRGTFRDVLVASRKSALGPAHCDTGTIPFTATHH